MRAWFAAILRTTADHLHPVQAPGPQVYVTADLDGQAMQRALKAARNRGSMTYARR